MLKLGVTTLLTKNVKRLLCERLLSQSSAATDRQFNVSCLYSHCSFLAGSRT
jgi:hypothetical protein